MWAVPRERSVQFMPSTVHGLEGAEWDLGAVGCKLSWQERTAKLYEAHEPKEVAKKHVEGLQDKFFQWQLAHDEASQRRFFVSERKRILRRLVLQPRAKPDVLLASGDNENGRLTLLPGWEQRAFAQRMACARAGRGAFRCHGGRVACDRARGSRAVPLFGIPIRPVARGGSWWRAGAP